MNRREFILLCAMPIIAGCGGGSSLPQPDSQFETGVKYLFEHVPTVRLSGNWLQMGRQYGRLLSREIGATYALVAPYGDSMNPISGRTNVELAEDMYQAYPQRIRVLFQGMSETSGLTLDQLKLTNAIEIVLMLPSSVYATRCSALSTWGPYTDNGQLIYGRNYDYNEELTVLNDGITVTVFHPNDGSMAFAICTWAGCIYASTGINRAGIYVEENDCSGHDRESSGFYLTGTHYNFKVWQKDDAMLLELLSQSRTMAEADSWMHSNLPAYPHNIGLADRFEARSYLWNVTTRIPHAPWVRQAEGLMAQTNHYFDIPAGWNLAPYVEQGANGTTVPGGSIPRLENLLNLAERSKGSFNVDRMCEVMDMKFADGGATVDGTLYQVVCEPATLTFRLKTKARTDRWVEVPLAQLLI